MSKENPSFISRKLLGSAALGLLAIAHFACNDSENNNSHEPSIESPQAVALKVVYFDQEQSSLLPKLDNECVEWLKVGDTRHVAVLLPNGGYLEFDLEVKSDDAKTLSFGNLPVVSDRSMGLALPDNQGGIAVGFIGKVEENRFSFIPYSPEGSDTNDVCPAKVENQANTTP